MKKIYFEGLGIFEDLGIQEIDDEVWTIIKRWKKETGISWQELWHNILAQATYDILNPKGEIK